MLGLKNMTNAIDIRQRFNNLAHENVIYNYMGELSRDELDEILLHLEDGLITSLESRITIKKIYNILVEGLQNIFLYKLNTDLQLLRQSFVSVNEGGESYHVAFGNFVLKDKASSIESRISIVNALDRDELKSLYRGVLDIGDTSSGGGAGLGFIDMAKRASGPLKYSFEEVDDYHLFFTLELEVDKKK